MKQITKTKKAYAVVSKDTRELQMFGQGEVDSYAVFFSELDAKIFDDECGPGTIVLPCTISYETLIP